MILSSLIVGGLAAAGFAAALPQSNEPVSERNTRPLGFDFGSATVRGVNIGGWLVLEPWITPSIFNNLDPALGIVDEYTLTQKLGSQRALQILRPHWDSWCTFADFQKIASAGFNSVRIPIGYWAYANFGEPYTSGAAPYIDAAIDWARALGLKIWIDLHGAPSSQNGFDNSGHKTTPKWQQGDTVRQTLQVLKQITEKYAQDRYGDVIVAIQLLNEPLSPVLNWDVLKQFYRDGYYQTRDTSDVSVVIHDAFASPSAWDGFLTPGDNNAQHVIVDHHEYQVFDNEVVGLAPWQHRQLVCNRRPEWSNSDKWLVVGEWSAAQTDCALHLNSYRVGARFDGSYPGSSYHGSCADKTNIANWNSDYRGDVRGFIEAQLDTYEKHANGWFFWNFKTEQDAHEWNAFALLDAGLFPQPLTNRLFGPVCSS